MSRKQQILKVRPVIILPILISLALLTMSSIAMAQTGNYSLSWWTVDNGGGESAGGAFSVTGTLGQPDAAEPMSGGQFTLQGGFWPTSDVSPGPPSGDQQVYLPLIMR